MSIITQQPDVLSFAKNLKSFKVSSSEPVSFQLAKGATQILNETYQPGEGDLVEIDLTEVIDKLLSLSLPTVGVFDQVNGVASFIATVDETEISFTVIKGGVAELDESADAFLNDHFLSWQIQDQKILQIQPEWLTLYTNSERIVKVKAYFLDETNETVTFQTLNTTGKLYTIDVSWAAVNAALVKKNPVIWDIWFEDDQGTRLSYVQRFRLRKAGVEENLFIWQNTLGGFDSVSFKGFNEDDLKLDHQVSEGVNNELEEYYIDFRRREIKQSCGHLTKKEARWIDDFFLSMKRFKVEDDGSVKSIVFKESKSPKNSQDDLDNCEFTYRYAYDYDVLNLDRTFDPLPVPEVPDDFFLTELLSGLAAATYSDNLLIAVQNKFASGWMQISIAQLWANAPCLLPGTHNHVISDITGLQAILDVKATISYVDTKVAAIVNSAPETLDTLNELATALGDDPNFATTVANQIGTKLSASDQRISNWNTAYGWGNHAGLYRAYNWVPSWTDVSSKPTWMDKMGWDAVNGRVILSSDLHIEGNITASKEIAAWIAGAIESDVLNTLIASAPLFKASATNIQLLYNTSQFEVNTSNQLQIKAGILAPAYHTQDISTINGLQIVLDGKQPVGSYVLTNDSRLSDARNAADVYSWAKQATKPSESDPIFSASPAAGVTSTNLSNWNTAYGWGNHAGLYRAWNWVPSWTDITSKPVWTDKITWDSANSRVNISTDLFVTGNIFASKEIASWIAGAIESDVLNTLTASAPLYKASATNIQLLYNTSQFEVNSSNQLQIKAGILAPAYHTQDISTINGLQSALDGKEPMITAGTTAQYWRGDKTWQTMPTSLPASDVYSWAKASLKPGYSWTEIGSRPTALSQFTNDLGNYGGFVTGTPWTGCGYITGTDNRLSDARPASDVYAWAKAASKPSYSYSEVGAAAASHSHDYATHRSEGSQFVDYAWGMYDQYRGGWRPSGDLKVAYSAQADNSQNSTLLEGYGASNFLGKNGTSYYQASDWIQLSGAYGLYCTLNEAHFFPNDGTYGAWKISGSRNGWSGIEFADSTTCLMVNYSASGIYNLNYGWQIQWSGGVLQVSKSSYGGPTMATVLDSSNYSSYALPITGGTVNGNITASYMYAYNFIGNSDRSLKENIRALNPEKLNIDYKSFFFKDEPGVLRYGAIAQEVKVDYPELVFRLESGKFGISYQDLLVREVAYLKSITEQLINENSSLRFDLMNIQNQLSQRA